MKAKQIAEKKEKELEKFITDTKNNLLKLSFDVRTKESNKVRDIRKLKRDLARAQTIKRERELAEEEAKQDKEKK